MPDDNFTKMEYLAAKNLALPKSYNLRDAMIYYCLRSLYRDYLKGYIKKEDASREKKLLQADYQRQLKVDALQDKMLSNVQENRKKAQIYMEEIVNFMREYKSPYDLLLICFYCIAALTNDPMFASGAEQVLKDYMNGLKNRTCHEQKQ